MREPGFYWVKPKDFIPTEPGQIRVHSVLMVAEWNRVYWMAGPCMLREEDIVEIDERRIERRPTLQEIYADLPARHPELMIHNYGYPSPLLVALLAATFVILVVVAAVAK